MYLVIFVYKNRFLTINDKVKFPLKKIETLGSE